MRVLRSLTSLYAVLPLLDVAYHDGGGEPRYLRVKRVTDPCELNLFVLDAHYALGTPATNAAEDDRTVEGMRALGLHRISSARLQSVDSIKMISSGVVSPFVKSCFRDRPSFKASWGIH